MIPRHLRRAAAVAALALAPAAAAAQGHAGHELPMTMAGETPPPLFTNLGTYSKKISTHSDSAQRYFDQGVRLLYGFNHMEAMLAFREAARLDPRCAICWWGVAQSYGPDINQEMDRQRWETARDAILLAQRLRGGASPWEGAYINAAYDRFVPTPDWRDTAEVRRVRRHEDSVYANNMRALATRYHDDPDAITWYAESLLDLSPWNQWSHDGSQPLPGTMDAVNALKFVIDHWPDHPGGNHFYIHAVEASDHPGDATASADRLAALMPGASHIVHMPSHVYLRTGRMIEAARANVAAVKADTNYLFVEKRLPLGRYPRYFAHNLEFLWAGAGMSAQWALSRRAAVNQAAEWPADSAKQYPNTQHFLTTPLVVAVRFGDWATARDAPPPPAELRFARGVWHYAHGFALLRLHAAAAARGDLAELHRLIAISTTDSVPSQSINSGRSLLRLASATLAGEILAGENNPAALDSLRAAALIQDALRYDEPPPFYFPVRHSLGRVLLQFGRAKEAECVYLADLKLPLPADCGFVPPTPHPNPVNLWSYKGLELAYRAQGRSEDARRAEAAFVAAATASDVKPRITASEF
jgi:tetratricopeptide (TPR) repeat protein